MTNIPKAALKQLEEAEKLHTQMYVEQDTSEDEAPQETLEEVESADPQAESNPEPETPEPVEQGHVFEEEGSLEEKYHKLEQAHKTLQGKYRAEVVQVNAKNRELQEQLQNAKRAQANAEQTAQDAQEEMSKITERLREEVGDDVTSAVSEYTSHVVNKEIESFKAETQQEQVNRFWNHINSEVADFQEVNGSKEFVDWLYAKMDSATGLTLHDKLNKAGSDLNAATVVSIVQQFKREQTMRTTDSQTTLQNQVVPPRKQPQPPVEQTPKYTAQDYTNLQDQIRRGMWRGREEEARALEQEIHAALIG